jgi:hypothetical protein
MFGEHSVLTLEQPVVEKRFDRASATPPAPRLAIAVPARITWKDASGAVRFASVMTRNVSETGAFVECEAGAAIPLYRLVHLQLERKAGSNTQLPSRLREGRVLSAVWRVAPCRKSTGTPSGYALRFLVDPQVQRVAITSPILEAVAV